jgi:hypothetical protein
VGFDDGANKRGPDDNDNDDDDDEREPVKPVVPDGTRGTETDAVSDDHLNPAAAVPRELRAVMKTRGRMDARNAV